MLCLVINLWPFSLKVVLIFIYTTLYITFYVQGNTFVACIDEEADVVSYSSYTAVNMISK